MLMEAKVSFINKDIDDYSEEGDTETIVMNPPFGVQKKHADRAFLKKAMSIGAKSKAVVYSLHKADTLDFVIGFFRRNGYKATPILEFNFPLRYSYTFHTKRVHRTKVICLKAEKSMEMTKRYTKKGIKADK